jgi:hypothetical protein
VDPLKDWRLTNQEKYLKGATLYFRSYDPANPTNDHDHCEFCSVKFMTAPSPGALTSGYTTADKYRWICGDCYGHFRDLFQWQVAP